MRRNVKKLQLSTFNRFNLLNLCPVPSTHKASTVFSSSLLQPTINMEEQTFKLNIFDPEKNRTYTLLLGEEDYQRALSDYTFSQSLLESATKNDSQVDEEDSEVLLDNGQKLTTPKASTSCNSTQRWDREAILALIKLYQDYEHKLKSTSIKNEHVWKEIANEMQELGHNYSKTQVENKFKYLKGRYLKKKDNLGSRGTGESPVSFDYFQEFDDIFGKKPNVTPVALASSLADNEEEKADDEPPMKKSRLAKEVSSLSVLFEANEKRREEEKERRHRERQELTKQAINVYESVMNKLIDKLLFLNMLFIY